MDDLPKFAEGTDDKIEVVELSSDDEPMEETSEVDGSPCSSTKKITRSTTRALGIWEIKGENDDICENLGGQDSAEEAATTPGQPEESNLLGPCDIPRLGQLSSALDIQVNTFISNVELLTNEKLKLEQEAEEEKQKTNEALIQLKISTEERVTLKGNLADAESTISQQFERIRSLEEKLEEEKTVSQSRMNCLSKLQARLDGWCQQNPATTSTVQPNVSELSVNQWIQKFEMRFQAKVNQVESTNAELKEEVKMTKEIMRQTVVVLMEQSASFSPSFLEQLLLIQGMINSSAFSGEP